MQSERSLINYFFDRGTAFSDLSSSDKSCPVQRVRKGLSCEHALNSMVDDWRLSLDNHRSTIAIFLDLRKAFDTVDHEILISKLGLYGFSNTLLALMRNYLEDRHFRVRLGNELSEKVDIQLGVPHGSILGPLLFLIYINDLSWYDLIEACFVC